MTKGTVIVLGSTGRNFAAGMTGGIAFVWDETGLFSAARCNRSGVDLEALTGPEDIATVQNLIRRHHELTGSPRAARILADWNGQLAKFVKVFPHEYKRALGIPLLSGAHTAGSRVDKRSSRKKVEAGAGAGPETEAGSEAGVDI
jgi:glutamate synthase domain-containing protein 3